jgi:hypothetical protein
MPRINSIKVSELKKLRDNYKSGLAAGETTSCFIYIKELIELIQSHPKLKNIIQISGEIDSYLPLRLYLVREELNSIDSLKLYGKGSGDTGKPGGTDDEERAKQRFEILKRYEKPNSALSQIVPVFVLCENDFEGKNITEENNPEGFIKVLRPGGEGTGICPPPPGDNEG